MDIIAALTTYAESLDKRPDAAQTKLDKDAAVAALLATSSLIGLRFERQRISPSRAAEMVRRDRVVPGEFRRWARTIDAYQRGEDENPKVAVLVRVVPGDFTKDDWIDLALAAIDQAGVDVRVQEQIETMLRIDDRDDV